MIMLLVGAEGVAELKDVDWARPALPDEVELFKIRVGENKFNSMVVDHNGRPYEVMVVSQSAPEHKKARAQQYDRVLRL